MVRQPITELSELVVRPHNAECVTLKKDTFLLLLCNFSSVLSTPHSILLLRTTFTVNRCNFSPETAATAFGFRSLLLLCRSRVIFMLLDYGY